MRKTVGMTAALLAVVWVRTAAAGACCPGEVPVMKACPADKACPMETAVKGVSVAEVKKLVDSKAPVTLVDARTGKWDDGRRIPGARSLAPDASAEAVAAVLPDKDAQVVTYCSGLKCPASAALAKNLRGLGYKNVLEFHEGIAGWTEAGNPVEQVKK